MGSIRHLAKCVFQVAVLGIFLSTQFAYGACSMTMQDDTSAASERAPCHPVAEDSGNAGSDVEADNCCVACVYAAILADVHLASNLPSSGVQMLPSALSPTGAFDPPYRPPAPAP